MTVEWPPRVWHGVIDPHTGEDIPPIRMRSGASSNCGGNISFTGGLDDCEFESPPVMTTSSLPELIAEEGEDDG